MLTVQSLTFANTHSHTGLQWGWECGMQRAQHAGLECGYMILELRDEREGIISGREKRKEGREKAAE